MRLLSRFIALPLSVLVLSAGSIYGSAQASGAYPDDIFVTEWNVEAGDTVQLPLIASVERFDSGTDLGEYDFTVNWGDDSPNGHVTKPNDRDARHTYSTKGTYTVTITGTIKGWDFGPREDSSKKLITSIVQWGNFCDQLDHARGGIEFSGVLGPIRSVSTQKVLVHATDEIVLMEA